jgi:secreted trypsin-like serine protease
MSCLAFGIDKLFLLVIIAVFVSPNAAANENSITSGVQTDPSSLFGNTIVDTPPLVSKMYEDEHEPKGNAARTFGTIDRNLRKRIVGGTNVTKTSDFPSWVDVNGCGGTLIDRYFVLTSAHCVNTPEKQETREFIYLGAFTDTTGTEVRVVEFIFPPGDEDIALLRIECASRRRIQRLNFDPSIPRDFIREPNTGRTIPQPLTVIGMGRTSTDGPRSSTLLQVVVNNVPIRRCNASFANYAPVGPNVINRKNMICAGNLETGGKDSCKGDSGGPLYIMETLTMAKP